MVFETPKTTPIVMKHFLPDYLFQNAVAKSTFHNEVMRLGFRL